MPPHPLPAAAAACLLTACLSPDAGYTETDTDTTAATTTSTTEPEPDTTTTVHTLTAARQLKR